MPQGSFRSLNIEKEALDKKFDLVICNDVLEHLKDDEKALCNIRKMTDRYFICNTIQGRMYESEGLVGHVRSYRKGELVEKLKAGGFRPIKIIEWGFPFYNMARKMVGSAMQNTIYGKYGLFKKAISHLMYLLYMLNSKRRGDIIIVLSEVDRQL